MSRRVQRIGFIGLLAALFALVGAHSVAAQQPFAPPYYKVVDLGPLPGGASSIAYAVNDPPRPNGIDANYLSQITVVGQAKIGTQSVPFRWRNGVTEAIGNPSTMKSGIARDVNSAGKVVGEWTDSLNRRHAFIFDDANGFRELLKAETTHLQTSAWSINEQGKVAGYSLLSQAIPVRWDPDGLGNYPNNPTKLYTGAPLTFNSASCVWQGHAFNIASPISINEAGHLFSSWTITVTSECGWPTGYTVKSTYVYAAAKTANNGATWTTFGPPSYLCHPYWANFKYYECAHSQGIAINNLGTTLHWGAFYSNSPGYPMWDKEGVVRPGPDNTTSQIYFRGKTCQGIQFNPTAINDDNIFVGSALFQDNLSTNCLDGKPYKTEWRGFVIQHGPGAQYYYLTDRIRQDCGWTRLLPNDINNAGVIVGAGLHTDGSSHAFMLIPTSTLPATHEAGCAGHGESVETNQAPVADAGPDQVVEATSPAGAQVTLNGAGSTDPDNDPLTYNWTTPFDTLSGVSPAVTLPLGVHPITLTVDDEQGGTDNDSVTVTVQDTTPPETTITAQPAALSTAASPSFSFEGLDIVSIAELLTFECSLDGAPWAACTSPHTYSNLAEGAHEFRVRATDESGNTDATPATFQWTVDTTPPTITLDSPGQGAKFALGSSQAASYSCSDGGSGINMCSGTLPDGSSLSTGAVGSYSFTVDATDLAGNQASLTHHYTVSYGVCGYEQFAARRAGSVIPVKVFVCDSGGANLSAQSRVVTATGVVKVSDSTSAPLEDAGNANPDFNFRFDASLFGGAGGYIFNLNTSGLTTGTYWLEFKVSGDPATHRVEFQIR